VGPRNHVLDGVQIPQGERATFGGCLGYSKALANSILKICWVQAMQHISREGVGGIALCGRRLMSTITSFVVIFVACRKYEQLSLMERQ